LASDLIYGVTFGFNICFLFFNFEKGEKVEMVWLNKPTESSKTM